MGKRGPQPAPTKLRLLKGEGKTHPERINRNEPVPSAKDVKPPKWLGKPALGIWKQLAPDLIAKGVLTAWDVEAFAGYCDAVVRRNHASEMVAKEGQVVDVPIVSRKTGEIVGTTQARNQWVLVQRDADAQVQRWGARFGLTPSERSQIQIPEPSGGGDDLLT